MQKIFILLLALCCLGCSASHNETVRKKIRNGYVSENKKKPTINNTKKKDTKSEKLVATSTVSVTKTSIEEYINLYKYIAMENMKQYGIPASIKLAQGILESGSGTGKLSREANNHFGIKCAGSWGGESVLFTDDAPDECFRKYNSPLESFTDHSQFLVNRKHYQNLFTLDKKDYVGWAKGLKNAGYATDPRYPEKLISIIERYQLYQYDNLVLGNNYVYEPTKIIAIAYTNSYNVNQGDTLFSISKKFGMTVDELKNINNISDNNIKIGQTLKVK